MKRRANGQFAPKRRAARTRNPSTVPVPRRLTDAEIRRHVAAEASTARGHEGLALLHDRHARAMAEYRAWPSVEHHERMAAAHRAMAVSLSHLAADQRARRTR